jgi:hypothetical protein
MPATEDHGAYVAWCRFASRSGPVVSMPSVDETESGLTMRHRMLLRLCAVVLSVFPFVLAIGTFVDSVPLTLLRDSPLSMGVALALLQSSPFVALGLVGLRYSLSAGRLHVDQDSRTLNVRWGLLPCARTLRVDLDDLHVRCWCRDGVVVRHRRFGGIRILMTGNRGQASQVLDHVRGLVERSSDLDRIETEDGAAIDVPKTPAASTWNDVPGNWLRFKTNDRIDVWGDELSRLILAAMLIAAVGFLLYFTTTKLWSPEVSDRWTRFAVGIGFATVFFVPALVLLSYLHRTCFDRRAGEFRVGFFFRDDIVIPLRNIAAVQLCAARQGIQTTLVLREPAGERYILLFRNNVDKSRAQAGQLADWLGVPLLDHVA